jgi:hypothetical protein
MARTGRPKIKNTRVVFNCRLAPSTLAAINRLSKARGDIGPGRVIDEQFAALAAFPTRTLPRK